MKYPSIFYLPYSPHLTKEDRISYGYFNTIKDKQIIILEKLDGGNACLTKNDIFMRKHSVTADHSSFDYLKRFVASFSNKIGNLMLFGEYIYAIHSIKYQKYPDFFFLFDVYDISSEVWYSWDKVLKIAKELDLLVVPQIKIMQVTKESDLIDQIKEIMKGVSMLGGEIEGVVIKTLDERLQTAFQHRIYKYVRRDHIQTDDQWKVKWKAAPKIDNEFRKEYQLTNHIE